MLYIMELIQILLASFILFVGMDNVLIYPLTRIKRIALLGYIFLAYLITGKVNPGNVNMAVLTMGGALFIIFLSYRNIYNVGSAIAGYLVTVCLNYLVFMYLGLFGITPQFITDSMPKMIVFDIIFCGLTYAVTYYMGRGLRLMVEKYYGLLKKKSIRYFIFSNLCGCLIIFLLLIIIGRITGFTNVIVRQNGLIFLLLAFAVTIAVSGAVEFSIYKLWPEIVFKMQEHIRDIEEENKRMKNKERLYHDFAGEGKIMIKNGSSNLVLDIKDIYFIETGERGHIINIYGKSGFETVKTTTLKEICKDISAPLFRCHRSFVVNLEHISSIDGENILLDNGMKCKIAARSRTELINYYNSYKCACRKF